MVRERLGSMVACGAFRLANGGVETLTPPFPARDRYYVQAAFTTNGFTNITPSNGAFSADVTFFFTINPVRR